jgi:ferric-dicitrate binding protein FerR (iron transport regulator)
MSDDLKNIFPTNRPDTDPAQLLRYLNNQMSPAERQAFEAQLNEDPFADEALEGLQELPAGTDISGITRQLNRNLREQIQQNKKAREKKQLQTPAWLYAALLLILLLAIIGYFVIKKFQTTG